MAIYVKQPGLFTTIQDLGRNGFQGQGVVQSGAMDGIALRQANLAVGNKETEAGLEMTVTGPSLLFTEASLICVTGGGMVPRVNQKVVKLGAPLYVPKGSVVSFQSNQVGMRAYMAVAGGLSVPVVMNSKSTYVRAGIGGFAGRNLQQGDTVQLLQASAPVRLLMKKLAAKTDQWQADWYIKSSYQQSDIRVFPGLQLNWLTDESISALFQTAFSISNQSDRMGYRLNRDKPLQFQETKQLLSESVTLGAVQVPADGQPIVLMADRQTIGGYPRVLQIALVDIPKLAQIRPGQTIRFQAITIEDADALYLEQEKDMKQLKRGINLKWRQMSGG